MNRLNTFLAYLAPLLALILLRWLTGFDGLYGQDPYEYYRYTTELVDYFKHGNPPGDYFWPIGYPLTAALLNILIPNTALSLQIISFISLLATLIYTKKIILHLFPNQNSHINLYLFIFCFLSPFVFRLGTSIMSDMLALATLISATYYLLLYIQKGKLWIILLSMLLFGCSIMTRYAAVLMIAPLLSYLVIIIILKRKNQIWHLPLLLIFAIIPMIPHLMIRAANPAEFIFHPWIINWSPLNWFSRSFITSDGFSINRLPNILYTVLAIFHPRYFVLGILIIVMGFKNFKWPLEAKIFLISIVVYFIFLAGIPFQNDRFFLLSIPFILIIFFQPYLQLISKFKFRTKYLILLSLFVLQMCLTIFSFLPIYKRSIQEKQIFQYVLSSGEPAIYTMDMDISLKGRGSNAKIYNIWNQFYEYPDTKAIILFNIQDYPMQWKGMNPMKNWNHFNKNYTIKEVYKFDKSWRAYEFK